jgi:hypothetical protein
VLSVVNNKILRYPSPVLEKNKSGLSEAQWPDLFFKVLSSERLNQIVGMLYITNVFVPAALYGAL